MSYLSARVHNRDHSYTQREPGCVPRHSIVMLSVVMLSVILLSVVMLNVVAPLGEIKYRH